jgi:membrane protein YqaA with SNARE-associated domain
MSSPDMRQTSEKDHFSRSERLIRFAVRHGGRPRTAVALALVSVGDVLLPALPTQTSVIALGLLQPQRAFAIALGFAAAAATGALLIAGLLHFVAPFAQSLAQASLGEDWRRIAEGIRAYGVWAVLLASIFPTPPRTVIAASLLSGVPTLAVAAAVFCGKALWFGAVLSLLRFAPQRMRRMPWIGARIQRLDALRQELSSEQASPR